MTSKGFSAGYGTKTAMPKQKNLMRTICRSEDLGSGGLGFRFSIIEDGVDLPAFVIRYSESVYGFVNRCAHRDLELDWSPGDFFDREGRYLICATHGALYEPETGICVAGPCKGQSLRRIDVTEIDGVIYLET